MVAALLFAVPAHAISCWVVRKAVVQYGEAAVESWARSKGISTRTSRRPGDASERFLPVETMVQAVPDQAVVLDFA